MSQLGEFFKGSETSLGVFYPHHSMIAIYATFPLAEMACQQLRSAGFSKDDAIAVSGADLQNLVREETVKYGLFRYLITEFSRLLDTEVPYTDDDLARAKKGAAVLAVQCADEQAKQTAWRIIAPTGPLVARYYAADGLEHLAGEN